MTPQLLFDGILDANTDHSALKECKLGGSEDKPQVLLLALLCLLGCVTEGIASVLVWQHLEKGGIELSPAWCLPPTRISWPSSQRVFLFSLRQKTPPSCALPPVGLCTYVPLNMLMILSETATPRLISRSEREVARRGRKDKGHCTAVGIPVRS